MQQKLSLESSPSKNVFKQLGEKKYRFRAYIQYEKFYNPDSNWGVYTVSTDDPIPHTQPNDFPGEDEPIGLYKYVTTLTGIVPQLKPDFDYVVEAELQKSNYGWQYKISKIDMRRNYTSEDYKKFLYSLVTERQAKSILAAYPDFVQKISSGEDVDYKSINGIGKRTYRKIKDKILENFVLADLLAMLSPHGITLAMIKKISTFNKDAGILKQKIDENPYILVDIDGLGWKRVDSIALKLKSDLRVSDHRARAFVEVMLKDISNNEGSSFVGYRRIWLEARNYIPECINNVTAVIKNQQQYPSWLKSIGDEGGLMKHWKSENIVYKTILRLQETKTIWDIDFDQVMEKYHQKLPYRLTEEQLAAVRDVLTEDAILIAGYAGTGKSTVLDAILFVADTLKKDVTMCALSAKAVQRITEVTGRDAFTMHRSLGWMGSKFLYNSEVKMPGDLFIVDESSMVNNWMFRSWMEAVPDHGKIILVGDDAQLPPIGAGNVFTNLKNWKS